MPLIAFVCDDGVFEFLRTPFGGRSCGSTFIRAMQQMLKPIKGFTEAYVDDLIVHTHANSGNIFGAHLQQIERFAYVCLSLCLSVCVSVRVSSLSRSHFFVDFQQI